MRPAAKAGQPQENPRRPGPTETLIRPRSRDSNLLAQMRGLLPSLVPSVVRVATVILNDPRAASDMTISQLAAKAKTSETTVMRLCRELGSGGYRNLRIALARESALASSPDSDREIGSDIGRDDSLDEIIAKITFADVHAVTETASLIDRKQLAAVVDAVAVARRVDVFGVGASAFVAMDLAQKLQRIGVMCFCWSDQHTALTSTALLGDRDVAIGISHTGATRDVVETIEQAGRTGAKTVAITSVPRSPLAAVSQFQLVTAARETTFRSGAMASRIAALSLVDVLFVAVAQRNYDRTIAALDATRRAVSTHRLDSVSDRNDS